MIDNGSNIIAIEGLIGVGKSTLCNNFVTKYPQLYKVYKEETNESLLELFYNDPKKYGFALQLSMLKTRLYQFELSKYDNKHICIPKYQYYLWDRSMIGDYIFALTNHLLGSISVKEMETYEYEFGGTIMDSKVINNIGTFLLLNDEPINCKYRVETMRLNMSEHSIPLSYYEAIDDVHFSIFTRLLLNGTNVIVQDWNTNIDIIKQLWHHNTPTINIGNSNNINSNSIIYRNSDNIIEAYNSINSGTYLLNYNIDTVYIPINIMRINPKDKNMDPELCYKYNITLYENEYKRVMLWHLSRFHNIIWY